MYWLPLNTGRLRRSCLQMRGHWHLIYTHGGRLHTADFLSFVIASTLPRQLLLKSSQRYACWSVEQQLLYLTALNSQNSINSFPAITKNSSLESRKTHQQPHLVFIAWRYASVVYAVVVCLSVCPSDTHRYCIKMAKCRIMQTTPYDSPGTLSFYDAEDLREILTRSLLTEAPSRDGVG